MDRAGRAPKKSVVGRDCNAVAKTAGFFEGAPRSTESFQELNGGADDRMSAWGAHIVRHYEEVVPTAVAVLDLVVEHGLCSEAKPLKNANGPKPSETISAMIFTNSAF